MVNVIHMQVVQEVQEILGVQLTLEVQVYQVHQLFQVVQQVQEVQEFLGLQLTPDIQADQVFQQVQENLVAHILQVVRSCHSPLDCDHVHTPNLALLQEWKASPRAPDH